MWHSLVGCFSPKIWLAPSTSSRAARSFKNCPRPGLRQCFAANLWIMGVFPGLMSYQRASRGYQISTSGVLQVPFVAPTPLRRCWRQASVFSCRSVVGCCWAWLESHSNNTSNYSIAQLLFSQVADSWWLNDTRSEDDGHGWPDGHHFLGNLCFVWLVMWKLWIVCPWSRWSRFSSFWAQSEEGHPECGKRQAPLFRKKKGQ